MHSNIMILDDDLSFAASAAEIAKSEGFRPHLAHTVAQARALTNRQAMDLMLIDLELPDGSGLELLQGLDLAAHGTLAVVTGNPSIESAAAAVEAPVSEYLIKPFEPAKLVTMLRAAASMSELLGERTPTTEPIPGVITRSRSMHGVTQLARRVAATDASVFLEGETGTGKEVFARAIHAMSGRPGPFVAMNCGAIPHELLASQLFGHERGSFTGAVQRHIGVFEQAAHGTLFLDEITEMPAELQVYLLRALETGSVRRVGSTEDTATPVRILSASNRDPAQAVCEHRLREDLYYRLADFTVSLPPLRQRDDDAVLLARNFIGELNRRYDLDKRLAPTSARALAGYDWPGNVRELRSAVLRAYLLTAGDQVTVVGGGRRNAMPLETEDAIVFTIGTTWSEIERSTLLKVLAYCGNDKTAAAKMLGVSVRTIHNHIARLSQDEILQGARRCAL